MTGPRFELADVGELQPELVARRHAYRLPALKGGLSDLFVYTLETGRSIS